MNVDSFRKLYIHELKDLYNAENQLMDALPKMKEKASNGDLKKAFSEHLQETHGHVDRLKMIFKGLEVSAGGETCAAMEGLIKEGEEIIKSVDDRDVLDAALIGAAQRVEHYEIAAYGTACSYAKQLGETEAETLLQETLDEESAANETLTRLAVSRINIEAGS